MIKRNINLIVKLFALIIFISLLAVIYCCATAPSSNTDDTTCGVEEITSNDIISETDELASSETTTEDTEASTEVITEADTTAPVVLKTSPVLFTEIEYVCYYTIAPTEELLFKVQVAIERLEKLDFSEYTFEAMRLTETELNRLIALEHRVASDLAHYRKWEKEHYYAAKVWEYFRQRGFSNEITCAIIGNMMIETSGGTLNLNPTIYSPSKSHYGLCQWSQYYYPETKDISFEAQLEYLLGSMPWEFNTFGKLYKKGFNYVAFIKMTDTSKAAYAFAEVYERCGEGSYKLRQEAALRAYAYFDLDN